MFGALLQFVLCFFILIIFGIWVSLALCSVIVHVHIWNSGIPSAFRRAVYNHFINLNFTTGDMHGVSFIILNLLIMVFWWYFLLCNLFHVIYCVVLCFALIVFILCTLYCQFDCPFLLSLRYSLTFIGYHGSLVFFSLSRLRFFFVFSPVNGILAISHFMTVDASLSLNHAKQTWLNRISIYKRSRVLLEQHKYNYNR